MSKNKKLIMDDIEKQKILEESGIINFKLRLSLAQEGISSNAFAKKVGMSEAVIRGYLSGKTYPSLSRLAIIAKRCDVPIEWLATGKGTCRLLPNTIKKTIYIPVYQPQFISQDIKKNVDQRNTQIFKLPFDFSWTKYHDFNVEDLYVYWVKGDSMVPTISDYDALIINTAHTTPSDGYIYVVQYGESLSVKRIQNQGKYFLLLSDNEKYPSIQIEKSNRDNDFKIIGKVVCILKDLS